MKRSMIAVVSVIAILVFVGMAQATLITYSNNLTSTFDIASQSLPVLQFDTALGTLNSVSVTVSVNAVGDVGTENLNPTNPVTNRYLRTYFGSEITNGQLGLSLDSQNLANVSWNVSNSYLLNLTAYDGITDYAGTSGFSAPYLNQTDSHVINYSLAADLAKFEGTGNVNFIVDGTAYGVLSGPSNTTSRMRTTGMANVSVTYDFTPVPEPGALVLLGMAALGLLAYVWRRRS